MRQRVGIGFAIMLLLIIVVSATMSGAQERPEELPPLTPISTVRTNTLWVFNGRALVVCQGAWESWNRANVTCHFLETVPFEPFMAGDVVERIFYDGTIYYRLNDQTTWYAVADPDYAPGLSLIDGFIQFRFRGVISNLGQVDVGGMPATHYQYWSTDDAYNANNGQAVNDLFLSPDNLLLKAQFNRRGAVPSFGDGELSAIWSFSDFNTNIQVGVPPAEQIQGLESSPVSPYGLIQQLSR